MRMTPFLAGLAAAAVLCSCSPAHVDPGEKAASFDESSDELFAVVRDATPGVTWSETERALLNYAIPVDESGDARTIPSGTVQGGAMTGTAWNPSMFNALDAAMVADGWTVYYDLNVDVGNDSQWGYQKKDGKKRRFLIFAIDASTTSVFHTDAVDNP